MSHSKSKKSCSLRDMRHEGDLDGSTQVRAGCNATGTTPAEQCDVAGPLLCYLQTFTYIKSRVALRPNRDHLASETLSVSLPYT